MIALAQADPLQRETLNASQSARRAGAGGGRSVLGADHPTSSIQRTIGDSLNAGSKAEYQISLRKALDRSPRVASQLRLAETLSGRNTSRRFGAGEPAAVQRKISIVDSSKKGKKSKAKEATAADVEDWVFQNIGKAESKQYPAGYDKLIEACGDDDIDLTLDTARAGVSFGGLRMVVAPKKPAADLLGALSDQEQFELIDRTNYPVGDLGAKEQQDRAKLVEQWESFLASYDKNWDNLSAAMKDAGKADYRGLPKLVSLILKRYADLDPVYVGVGSSPDIIIEYLRQTKPGQAVATIPISTVKLGLYQAADEQADERVFAYLEKTLGRWWNEARNLVLIDATEQGDTLEVIQDYLERHDQAEDISREVVTASLSATATYPETEDPEKFGETDIEVVKTADHEIAELMRTRFYYQNVSGYKTVVGRMYDKVNLFKDILSGATTEPGGYDRQAHLQIIKFVHFVREGAKKLAREEARDDESDDDFGGINIDDL